MRPKAFDLVDGLSCVPTTLSQSTQKNAVADAVMPIVTANVGMLQHGAKTFFLKTTSAIQEPMRVGGDCGASVVKYLSQAVDLCAVTAAGKEYRIVCVPIIQVRFYPVKRRSLILQVGVDPILTQRRNCDS